MTREEADIEHQKIYEELVNTCIRHHVTSTDYYSGYATVHYGKDISVTVSEGSHCFKLGLGTGGKTFHSNRIKLDQDFHDFVMQTAILDMERQEALLKVENELLARKERVARIVKLKSFLEDFKNAI
jgi:hypothetical protein